MEKGGKNIMGKLNRTHILRLVSIIVALTMIVPGAFLTQQFKAATPEIQTGAVQSGPTAYAYVNFDSPAGVNVLNDIGAKIVSLRENGAYVKITESQKEYLSTQFDLNDLPSRTVIDLPEQGIYFDSQVGYNLPAQWRNPSTDTYMVQLVAPSESAWLTGIEGITGQIECYLTNNLVVVKMTDTEKAKVSALDYVQWVGAYEPGFKMDKKIPSTGIVKLTVFSFPNVVGASLASELAALGATNLDDGQSGYVTCTIDATALPALAKLESVKQVQNLAEMHTMVNVGGRIVQAQDLWVNTVSNLPQNIMGQGQTVHIQDTGVDATIRDFNTGPLGNRLTAVDSGTDTDGHGTHVTGIVAGNGYNMEAYLGLSTTDRVYNSIAASNPAGRPDRMGFAGRAPEASIYFRAGLVSTEWAAGYTAGARIFTNSWGSTGNGYDASADTFMLANANSLVLFSAGNDGPGTNTAMPQGNSKNGLSVGAVENMRPIDFDSSDDPNQMIGFSSRGPSSDGRIKPDICEIGTAVYSTCSAQSAEYAATALYDPLTLINMNVPANTLGDYVSLQGTSMSCPAAAGDTVLIRDYLVDVRGIAAPHATLMKGLLIHGAEDMGLGYPSNDQGWGRINVRNSICPAFPNVLQFAYNTGIGSGSWNARTNGGLQTWVIDNTVPLKITMVHTDSGTASGELVNDYNLVVTSPSGKRYEGNAFYEAWSRECNGTADWAAGKYQWPSWTGGGSYDFDEDNNGGDSENNIEMFRIKNPEKGQWNVQVVYALGTTVPFTLAMTGGFNASADVNAPSNAYRVNLGLDVTRIVPERDDFGEAIFKAAPSGSVIVPYWINNGGTTTDTYAMSTPILPAGITVSYTPVSPVSVAAGIRTHGYARIMVGAAVTAGTYTVSMRATSNNDVAAPIAQSEIKFQIDVVTTETPPQIKIAATPAHESAPSLVSWTNAGVNYIGCAYTQDTRYGERVYFKLSSDGGATWGASVVISAASWSPGFVGIARASSGTYLNRLMIVWNAWNPADGMFTGAAVQGAYADAPYTTWTATSIFTNGQGRNTYNSYRTVNINWHRGTNAWLCVVETFGYDGVDPSTATNNDISCCYKVATTGGGTWSALGFVDPNGVNLYYFFPSVAEAPNGACFVYFYERDAAAAAQDRDASFREYSPAGAWGTYYVSMNTLDNMMMPCSLSTTEGTGNRRYGIYLKGANTDGDRYMNLHYSDTGTTWQTNGGAGWQLSTTVMSDHDYGTRFVFDAETSNGWDFVFGHRKINYDPYGVPNLLMVYGTDLITARTETFLTLDSFVHGKQRACNTTHDATPKVFVAQNQMTTSGGHDIIGMHVYNGWAAAPDIWGPVTEYLSADKTICNQGDTVTVVANVHDWTTGGSNIGGAQYKTDVNNLTWVAMQSFDGSFNSPAEAVQSTTTPISTAGWSVGWHWIFVRGSDAVPNNGAEVGIRIYVNAAITPTATATGPIGTSNVAGVTITYTWTSNPTSVNLYYTTNGGTTWTSCGATDTSVDGSYAFTCPAPGTYGWIAQAVGGAPPSTEPSPPTGGTTPEATSYIYDITPPAVPNPFTVAHWGITSSSYNESRAFRSDTHTINTLLANQLQTTNTAVAANTQCTVGSNLYTGIRVWKRSATGTETEITAGSAVAITSHALTSTVELSATWACPGTTLATTDSIVIRVYQMFTTTPPTTLSSTFTTGQLGATSLDAGTWTVYYWVQRAGATAAARIGYFHYGNTATYNSRITGFEYTAARDPLQDNTLNWTHSGVDVSQYVVYRSALSTGPWDGTTEIATVPVGTTTYLDSLRGTADGTLWYYVVRAVDAAGNGVNTAAVQEPGVVVNPAYSIPLTGKLANSWVFVSFPSATSGAIQTVLNDATAGDGLTTWTVAKWFNAQDKADPWKTYRVGSTVNDMPTLTSSMGVWLWITANGGDQKLTLNSYVANATTNVLINLYAGWNMVGYPSATARLGTATLPVQADYVSVWQAASPYVSDLAPGVVTMTPGNAYWVRVTADCTWTVVNP
jgi:hypothetical protein